MQLPLAYPFGVSVPDPDPEHAPSIKSQDPIIHVAMAVWHKTRMTPVALFVNAQSAKKDHRIKASAVRFLAGLFEWVEVTFCLSERLGAGTPRFLRRYPVPTVMPVSSPLILRIL